MARLLYRQSNLLRDGVEATAAHVLHTVQRAKGRQTVLVRRFGKVCVYRPARVEDRDAENIVGTYTDGVPPEVVENDLLCRLRELSERMASSEDGDA